MKRSRAIQLTLVTSMASLLVSCDNRPTRYCVDGNQNVTDDKNCDDRYYTGASYHSYHWYYGGAHGRVHNGTHLTGGSVSVPSGGFVTPLSDSVGGSQRGIFGHSGEALSSGHHFGSVGH